MLPQAVSDHYRAQQRLTLATLSLVRREWANIGDDFDTGWRRVGPRIVTLTAAAQLGAARDGVAYVPATLEELGQAVAAEGTVNAAAFAGIASDGRPLDSLLYGAVIEARTAQADSLQQRLMAGRRWLDMAVHTQVSDAARSAASVAISARPKVGYVRMVNPPCCSRCAVLAGKVFKSNTGFPRHPRCDCRHIPTTLANPAPNLGTDPPLDQITDLTQADRKALAAGADFNQVANAKRGRRGMTTTEGTSRSGVAGQRLQGRRRLTPDGIYRISSDEDEARRLLRQHGYLL